MSTTLRDALKTAAFWDQKFCLRCGEAVATEDEADHEGDSLVDGKELQGFISALVAEDEDEEGMRENAIP